MVRAADVGRLIVLFMMMGLLPTPSVAQTPAAPPAAGGAQPAPATSMRPR